MEDDLSSIPMGRNAQDHINPIQRADKWSLRGGMKPVG